MRVAVIVLLLAACEPAIAADVTAPEPVELPAYVPPLTVLDELKLPTGDAPIVREDEVCYEPRAHLRLITALKVVESLSNQRARIAWMRGWQNATEADAERFDRERTRRLSCEEREAPQVSGQSGALGAATVLSWVGAFAVGAIGGAVAWEVVR